LASSGSRRFLSGSLAYAEMGNMTSELCTLMADLKKTVS
jgi:hypothetical protein